MNCPSCHKRKIISKGKQWQCKACGRRWSKTPGKVGRRSTGPQDRKLSLNEEYRLAKSKPFKYLGLERTGENEVTSYFTSKLVHLKKWMEPAANKDDFGILQIKDYRESHHKDFFTVVKIIKDPAWGIDGCVYEVGYHYWLGGDVA